MNGLSVRLKPGDDAHHCELDGKAALMGSFTGNLFGSDFPV